jgi:hypothetical protein
MRRSATFALSLLLLGGCNADDRSHLQRRAMSPASESGWGRVVLDGEAQRWEGVWLGDTAGRTVPFLREREGLWAAQELVTTGLLLGHGDDGRPAAEFALQLPDGWRVREREQLRVDLDLAGEGPWVARVEIARRLADGAFVTLEEAAPRYVYNLDAQRVTQLTLPWDGERYRLTLVPTQGQAPSIRGVKVTANTWPEAFTADETLEVADFKLDKASGAGVAELPQEQRVVALDVVVEPPCAPVGIEVDAMPPASTHEPGERDAGFRDLGASGLVWNLPAFHSQATRVTVNPTVTRRLRLRAASGVRIASARVLVRREALLFPVEAGQTYYLHGGGANHDAPGNLHALPTSRTIYGREPLRLAAAEPDPQGVPIVIPGSERTRPWLPWVVGLVVALLAAAAWRLLKEAPGR